MVNDCQQKNKFNLIIYITKNTRFDRNGIAQLARKLLFISIHHLIKKTFILLMCDSNK